MKTELLKDEETNPGFCRGQAERRSSSRRESMQKGRVNLGSDAALPAKFVLGTASETDREAIYSARYEVYAQELGQHAATGIGRLSDSLDQQNVYIVARLNGDLAGFISITPPTAKTYSVDKYFNRDVFRFEFDRSVYEIRLLTVLQLFRGGELASLLMYAALRWVEAHGGTRIVAIGRHEVAEMYVRSGLRPLGLTAKSGAVTYDLMAATTVEIREQIKRLRGLVDRIESRVQWNLPFAFRKPAACFHGGAFFSAIGERFDTLHRHQEIINADVLDAWFPPSPKVLQALSEYLPWLLKTSPPTDCKGLVETIATVRGVQAENILPGAGSSDLIFRALTHWLKPASHALILDPTYGEYAHVLEQVVGCTVDRLPLVPEDNYTVNMARLDAALGDEYDLIVLVNPNSPTGRHIPRKELEEALTHLPPQTRVWIDETYIQYAGQEESLERFAAESNNVIVCKSMSKVYALSGARVAYLCAGAHQLESLRAITPPWVVGLAAQLAAVKALEDPLYYAGRYEETHKLRERLASDLSALGIRIVPGIANFLLVELPLSGPNAATVVSRCREKGLFIRDARLMGARIGDRAIRIAVKDKDTNRRMVSILARAMSG
jgi:histidinol-phosphate/aromatic aminotransferase/cobyric acid decarboxylase-like protein/GNAT superfamily N-acetyltransferase